MNISSIHASHSQWSHLNPERPASRAYDAREAAKGLVASAFIVPMLAEIRESSRAVGPFAPTLAEKRFGPILDQQIADQVMQNSNFRIVDAIVDRFEKGERV